MEQEQEKESVKVKVSAKMARLPFNGCDPDYIRDVCKASCCHSSTSPSGIMVTIHPSEVDAIESLGGKVKDGLLQPKAGCRVCPFKNAENLCGIHFSGKKPFGCIASPFTLNNGNTLIVRNRYKLLKCYDDGKKIPAYVAFRASLDLIFGKEESARVCAHFDKGGGDIYAEMSEENFSKLKVNDEIKKSSKSPSKDDSNRLLLPKSSDTDFYIQKRKKEKELNRKLSTEEFYQYYKPQGAGNAGTSIFDPVLCELIYRWFCPKGGSIIDPFAGGSVRGIVAAVLGYKYTGFDISKNQVEANRKQAKEICRNNQPNWINKDSRKIDRLKSPDSDLVFSCPPYFDLEVYSDDKSDISQMSWEDFRVAYYEIISNACGRLKDNRFACFVVGDVRDKKGFYRNLPGVTIDAFQANGCNLYNDAILVTSVGSLPIRVGRQFEAGRKLGTTHQRVLVFFKGDPKSVKDWSLPEFGKIELAELGTADTDVAHD